MRLMQFRYFIFLSTLITCLSGCSGSREVQSYLNTKQLNIDGSLQDWITLDSLKGQNMTFGFSNDKENVYISFSTSDKNKMMKILTMGLTVWLESDKPKGRIGIIYPMKLQADEMNEFRRFQMEDEINRNQEERIRRLISVIDLLQVVNKDDLPLFTDQPDEGSGFNAKILYDSSQFVYELQISLVDNDIAGRVFGVDVDNYHVTFETGKPDRSGIRPGGGMRPGGGDGSMNEPRSPGESRNKSGRKFPGARADMEPLDYNFKVKLAE